MFTIDDASHPTGAALHRETRRRRDAELRNIFGRGFAAMAGLVRRFNEWRLRRATHAALIGLDDHLLSDIGLNRTDILNGRVPESRTQISPQLVEVKAVMFNEKPRLAA